MRYGIWLTVMACLLAGCAGEEETFTTNNASSAAGGSDSGSSPEGTDTGAGEDTENEATADVVVIDVRTQEEFDSGHVEGALHIPHTEIGDKIAAHVSDKDQKIAVYCKSGGRSGMAMETLKGLGYTQVENLGGLEDARAALKSK